MLKKGFKKVAEVANKTLVKDATSSQRRASRQIEDTVKALLEGLSSRVTTHVAAWNEYLLVNTVADAQDIQQKCEGFKADLLVLSPIFSNPRSLSTHPEFSDTEVKGLKEIAWDIHECNKDRVSPDGAEAQCNVWLGAVKLLRDQFTAKHGELSRKLDLSVADLEGRKTAVRKLAELSAKMSESRTAWGLLYGNTYRPINQTTVETALSGFDQRLAALRSTTEGFDALYTALDTHVSENIAARKRLEVNIADLRAAAEAARLEQSVNDLADSFAAMPTSSTVLQFSPPPPTTTLLETAAMKKDGDELDFEEVTAQEVTAATTGNQAVKLVNTGQ